MKNKFKELVIKNKFISKHLYFVEVNEKQKKNIKKFKGIDLHKHNAFGTKIIYPHKKY